MDRQEMYDRIAAAKVAIYNQRHPDAATARTEVKASTAKQYLKAAIRMLGTDEATGSIKPPHDADKIIKAVRDTGKKSTLRTRARAIRYVAMRLLDDILKRIDKAQRAQDWIAVERMVASPIFRAVTRLAEMLPSDYGEGWQATSPRRGKKASMQKLPTDWREQVARTAHGQFRLPVLVALVTGCRPIEINKGILLEQNPDGLYATINGGKVRDNAGQKQRRFRLADHRVTDLLMHAMQQSDATRSTMLIQVEHGNSVTTHLRLIGKKLWPRRKEAITVYTARHAMAADCKAAIANGADPDLVSLVLGHIVDKTASYYGSIFQSGGSSVAPSNTTATKPIKHKSRERNHARAANGIAKVRRARGLRAG